MIVIYKWIKYLGLCLYQTAQMWSQLSIFFPSERSNKAKNKVSLLRCHAYIFISDLNIGTILSYNHLCSESCWITVSVHTFITTPKITKNSSGAPAKNGSHVLLNIVTCLSQSGFIDLTKHNQHFLK